MGHSSPSVAARYYIHLTETHVAAGFGKFVEYQTRNVAEEFAAAFPQASEAVQSLFQSKNEPGEAPGTVVEEAPCQV